MIPRVIATVLIALSSSVVAQEPAKPAPEAKEPAKPEATKPAEPVLSIEKSTKPPDCIIKPVMTDDELRACGARIPK